MHRPKPNPERAAERFTKQHARIDRYHKEIVNLLTKKEVLAYLFSQFEGLDYFPNIIRGEVLNDS